MLKDIETELKNRSVAVSDAIIAVDFDGTLCDEDFPSIGNPHLSLIEDLINLQSRGSKLILWTCREGNRLHEAVEWCKNYGLTFDAINENAIKTEGIYEFLALRKIYATVYIDDRAISYKRDTVTYV